MLSHEFRTPLATIDGAIQRLVSTSGDHDEATRKRYVKIQTAVDRLLAMMDEYLSPERMAASAASASRRHRAAGLLQQAAATVPASHTVRLELDGSAANCAATCRHALCLDILLDNAVKFSPPGSSHHRGRAAAPEGRRGAVVRDTAPACRRGTAGCSKKRRGTNATARARAWGCTWRARVDVHGGSQGIICPKAAQISGFGCRLLPRQEKPCFR
jgi:hypothetical protein